MATGSDLAARPTTVAEHRWQGFRYESRVVRADKPRLAPALLVGGAFQRKEDWGRIEVGLLDHADVVTVDLPGWGAADLLPDTYGVDFLAEALDHLLGERGLTSLNVIGGSYGTAILYRLAQRFPERIARMVLVGTMTAIPDHAREAFGRTLDLLATGRMDEFAEATVDLCLTRVPGVKIPKQAALRRILVRRVLTATPHEIDMYAANTRRLMYGRLIDPTVPPTQPILVTTGEYDDFTTPDMCRELAATCADSWFAVVRDADHLLHLERAAEQVDLMVRFFEGRPITDLPYCLRAERVRG
jgi:pimeloyl-ACP methyl ester carboxylesterase